MYRLATWFSFFVVKQRHAKCLKWLVIYLVPFLFCCFVIETDDFSHLKKKGRCGLMCIETSFAITIARGFIGGYSKWYITHFNIWILSFCQVAGTPWRIHNSWSWQQKCKMFVFLSLSLLQPTIFVKTTYCRNQSVSYFLFGLTDKSQIVVFLNNKSTLAMSSTEAYPFKVHN